MKCDSVSELFETYLGREDLLCRGLDNKKTRRLNKIRNVAIFYPCFSIGGIERVISLQIPELLKLGYKVTLVLDEGNEKSIAYSIPNGVKIIFIPSTVNVIRTKTFSSREIKLNEIIVEEKIDLFVHQCASSNILAYDLLVFKRNNVYSILVHHELFSQDLRLLSINPYMQRYVYTLADKVVVLSETERIYYGILGIKTTYIPDPLGGYAVTSEPYNFQGDIVWVGRLDYNQKQYMDIIPIMNEVVKLLPNVKIRVYGPEWLPGSLRLLEDAVMENGLEDNVIYCGYVTGDTSKMYEDAAVHLVTSAYESFGMVIAEGKMNGIPLVLYKMPYLELLKDGKGYIAVENDDTKAVARAIVNILTDRQLAERLSVEAKQSVQKFINFDYGEAWRNLIEGLTDNVPSDDDLQIDVKSLKMIFDTIGYHYYKGVDYMNEHLNEVIMGERRSHIKRLLQTKLRDNECEIAIYPYGKWGKEIKDILNNDMGIQEAFIIDNKLSDLYEEIRSLSDLKSMDCSRYRFLVCSSNLNIHDELLSSLMEYVPKENIVDVFG
jgi:glycosyltransferase involved in cell wall biosynthesis